MCRHCDARAASCSTGSRTARSATSLLLRAYRMHGPVGSAFAGPKPDDDQRADVPDPQLPRLPLGQRRLLQRLPHPQHRRMLLDEGRLAGRGQGAPAAGTTAATTSTRTSTPTRSSTPSPTAPSCSSKAAAWPAATSEFASYAHGTKGSAVISTARPHAGQAAGSTRARRSTTAKTRSGTGPQPEPNPYQLEWDDLIDAIRNDKPYNEVEARRRGEPRHVDGPHGRPHRARSSPSTRCSTASTSSPRTSTS